MTKIRTCSAVVALAAATVVLTACSSTPSSISGSEIQKRIGKDLAKGQKAESLSCSKVDYKKGAKSTCDESVTTQAGVVGQFKVDITVSKADSDGKYEVTYKRVTPAESFKFPGDSLAADLKKKWNSTQTPAATAVTCPDLPGKKGAVVTCDVTAGGDQKVTATVTNADPSTLALGYQFAKA